MLLPEAIICLFAKVKDWSRIKVSSLQNVLSKMIEWHRWYNIIVTLFVLYALTKPN